MTPNTLKGKWATAVSILTATLVCMAVIGVAGVTIRYFKDGRRFSGRPLGEWMYAINDLDAGARKEAHDAIAQAGPDAVHYFVKILGNRKADSETRVQAVEALAHCGRKAYPAVPALMEVLNENDVELKSAVLNTLYRIPSDPEKLVPVLMHLLNDPSSRVRWRAAQGLGHVSAGAEKAIPALRQAVDDPDPTVREKALAALEKMGIAVTQKTVTTGPPPPPPQP